MAENKSNIHRSVRIVVDQHSDAIQKLADSFLLIHARDAMCGFIALAVVTVTETTEANILRVLERHILPWIVRRRETYVKRHGDEFVPNGTSYKDSQGRMSTDVYRAMMASTTELAEFVATSPLLQDGKVALLRNVLEGPVVDDASIRFPRGSFIPQEELDYVQQERPFWGAEHYVLQSGGSLVSLSEWCQAVVTERSEWKIIIDSHGHHHVLRIAFDFDNTVLILEELESMQRDDKTCQSQPCENLMRALENAWLKKELGAVNEAGL